MRQFFFTILFLLLATFSQGQVYYKALEFGISGGMANYFGDLNQEYKFKEIRESAGIFVKYNFGNYIALKVAGNYAHIGYNDKFSDNFFQQQRNLNFRSNIYEGSIQADFHFFQYALGDFDHRFTPYVALGFGIFKYDPYTEYEGRKIYLRPLGTEGQNYEQFADRRYTRTSLSIPIGLGIKYWMGKGITFGLEATNRITNTDYLDDVSATYVGANLFPSDPNSPYPTPASQLQDRSIEITNTPIGIAGRQRGISSTRDQIFMVQASLSFRLPTYRCPTTR
jgi:hypothetical protein